MKAEDLLIEAHRTTGAIDKLFILLVCGVALGVLGWFIYAIVRSSLNHERDG